MVTVRNQQVIREDGSVDLDAWIERLKEMVEITDVDGLRNVAVYAQELEHKVQRRDTIWADSASSFRSGLEMAEILAELHLDTDALKAALIYRAVREGQATLGEVNKRAGSQIAKLVEGVLRMAAISAVMNPEKKVVLGQATDQLDNLRKMLVAMVDDVRVARHRFSHFDRGVLDLADEELGFELGADGNAKGHHDAGDGGVDAAGQHRHPQQCAHQGVGQGAAHPAEVEADQRRGQRGGDEQGIGIQAVGVEQGDHRHRHQVVDNGQCDQERQEVFRHARPQQAQRADGECNIRGHGDAPAAQAATGMIDRDIGARGHQHAAECRHYWQQRLLG